MTSYAPFDTATYLDNDEVIAEYLSAAAEDPNPDVFLAALGDVAKARGMAQIAKAAGLGRESLYKALSRGMRPSTRSSMPSASSSPSRSTSRPPDRTYKNEAGSTSTSTRPPLGTGTFASQARSSGCTAMSRRVFNNSRRRCRPRRIDSGAGAGPSTITPSP